MAYRDFAYPAVVTGFGLSVTGPAVCGAVTAGSLWESLSLEGDRLTIDVHEWALAHPDRILGNFLHIHRNYPDPTP